MAQPFPYEINHGSKGPLTEGLLHAAETSGTGHDLGSGNYAASLPRCVSKVVLGSLKSTTI